MGEVYRARDSRLRREVAIKVLRESIASGGDWERFQREARAASALSHPNICAVYDLGEADGRSFLVMELLEGQTLRDYIGKKPVPTDAVVALALQIIDSLEAAHTKGILHRDIKPGNIMVNARRHVKVLDFGLAKQLAVAETDDTFTLESLTAAGTVMGTPHYMAPEILQGKPADARADLWALGIVLHEMLTGRVPFNGPTMFEVSSAILREPTPQLPASVPPGLRAVVEQCLAKLPEERYQNAGEIRSELETLQSDTGRKSSGPGWKVWLGAAGAAVVLAAAAFVWQTHRGSQVPGTAAHLSSNNEANDLFSLAMQFQKSQNDIPKAQELLERALALDPHFAEALRYHAFNYAIEILNGYVNDTNLLYRAEEELGRAAKEEPDLDDVHTALAAVYLMQGRKELVPAQLDQALARGAFWSASRGLCLHACSSATRFGPREIFREPFASNKESWNRRLKTSAVYRSSTSHTSTAGNRIKRVRCWNRSDRSSRPTSCGARRGHCSWRWRATVRRLSRQWTREH
jgi:serine/threonine protein kinase